MTACELCGSTKQPFLLAEVEGSRLKVCKLCASFGKALSKPQYDFPEKKEKQQNKQQTKPVAKTPEPYEAVVSDYAARIRKSREKLNLTQKEFAKHITEKESMVSHWENEAIEPSIDTAKKLEHTLHIKLIELRTEETAILQKSDKKGSTGLTIGDILAQKMKE